MSGEILVIGSLNMDLVVHAPLLPIKGETLLGSSFATYPGGKGDNQAIAAARAGGTVTMLGRVGTDGYGKKLLLTLRQGGVSADLVQATADEATGTALVTVDDNGENTIVVIPGANSRVSIKDIQAAKKIQGAGILVLQMEIPFECVQFAIETARQSGTKVLLNAAPARPLPDHLLNGLDYLVVNETELRVVGQLPPSADFSKACNWLLGKGVNYLVVTLGAEGVYLQSKQREHRIPAHEVEVGDSTAAGDAFVGVLAAGLMQALPLRQAAKIANAAGALAVSKAGAQPSLPNQSEIKRFLKKAQI